jgi:hypothetical protein
MEINLDHYYVQMIDLRNKLVDLSIVPKHMDRYQKNLEDLFAKIPNKKETLIEKNRWI